VLGTVVHRPNGHPAGTAAAGSATLARARAAAVLRPPGPIPGYLLIADRGNDRLLLVDGRKRIVWRYPATGKAPAAPFRFDDDAFFTPGFHSIISNQEDQDTIEEISFPTGHLLWRYGHFNVTGSGPGYLNTPDDAYLLRNGLVSVADAVNCRVLFITKSHRVARSIGTAGNCAHDPPRLLGPVNGATPLPNGDTLVSEIPGSWIDDVTRTGRVRWSFQAPVSYPSDPQPFLETRIVLADYANPGHVLILDHHGRVLWRYGPAGGAGALDHPSLALPIGHGLIAVNDDYHDRVVVISISQHRIVWQYGHTNQPGTRPGYLNTPDGMDLLPTAVAQQLPAVRSLLLAAQKQAVAPKRAANGALLSITPEPPLPAPVERAAAAVVGGTVVVAGGLDTSLASTNGVYTLDPRRGTVTRLGTVPQAFHDAAAAAIGTRLFVFGGGSAESTATVQSFDLRSRQGRIAGRLPIALSDLASVTIGGTVYLVGGWNGVHPQPTIWATTDGVHFRRAGALPVGLRYPAVAALAGTIVIAGGQDAAGAPTSSVFVFDPSRGTVKRIGSLPAPVSQAAAVAGGKDVFVLGGRDAAGNAVATVTAIDPVSGAIVPGPALPTPVADAAAAAAQQESFLIGGWRGALVGSVLAVRPR